MGEVAHATTDARGTTRSTSPAAVRISSASPTRAPATSSPRPRAAHPAIFPSTTWPPRLKASSSRPTSSRSKPTTASFTSPSATSSTTPASPPRTEWSPRTFEIALPPEAVVQRRRRAAAHRPAHQRQARPRRPQRPLRLQLSHPARRGRQEHALPDRIHPALQRRQIHLPSAGLAAHRRASASCCPRA